MLRPPRATLVTGALSNPGGPGVSSSRFRKASEDELSMGATVGGKGGSEPCEQKASGIGIRWEEWRGPARPPNVRRGFAHVCFLQRPPHVASTIVSITVFTGLVFGGAVLAGLLGALTGLGGGVVIVPMLTLLFHVDLPLCHGRVAGVRHRDVLRRGRRPMSVRIREHSRRDVFLEIATVIGAMSGAYPDRVPVAERHRDHLRRACCCTPRTARPDRLPNA